MSHPSFLALAGWGATAVAFGIAVYVAGSYALMRAHVEPRAWGLVLREALRELGWALLTQPLLPLFYVVGRRLARGRGVPIVTVHGYMQNRVDFLRIARACERAGLGPVYGFNYPWYESIPACARRLVRFVEHVCRETGAAQVDVVAHSVGGLVAMEYVHDGGGARVRRVVTIASPHAGVAWRGPIVGAVGPEVRVGCEFLLERAGRALPVPFLSVYSTHDNVVHPPQTSALAPRGGTDWSVAHVGHLAILFHPDAVRATVSFLAAPAPSADVPCLPPSAVPLEPERELVRA
jgi:pimeloyl-ACP methyl ester carboxylesterase